MAHADDQVLRFLDAGAGHGPPRAHTPDGPCIWRGKRKKAVKTLKTAQPTADGRPPGGTSRPVTVRISCFFCALRITGLHGQDLDAAVGREPVL